MFRPAASSLAELMRKPVESRSIACCCIFWDLDNDCCAAREDVFVLMTRAIGFFNCRLFDSVTSFTTKSSRVLANFVPQIDTFKPQHLQQYFPYRRIYIHAYNADKGRGVAGVAAFKTAT